MFTNDVFLDPILSIIIPIKIAPTTSPNPKATIPNNAYEYNYVSEYEVYFGSKLNY